MNSLDPTDTPPIVLELDTIEYEDQNQRARARAQTCRYGRNIALVAGVLGTGATTAVAVSVLQKDQNSDFLPVLLGMMEGAGVTAIVSGLPENSSRIFTNVEAVIAIALQYFVTLFILAKGCPWHEGIPKLHWPLLWADTPVVKQWELFTYCAVATHVIGVSFRTGYQMQAPAGAATIRPDPRKCVGYSAARMVKGVHSRTDQWVFSAYQVAKVVLGVFLLITLYALDFGPGLGGYFFLAHTVGTITQLQLLRRPALSALPRDDGDSSSDDSTEGVTISRKERARIAMIYGVKLTHNVVFGLLISIPHPVSYFFAGAISGAKELSFLEDLENTQYLRVEDGSASKARQPLCAALKWNWVTMLSLAQYSVFLVWYSMGLADPNNQAEENGAIAMSMALPLLAYLARTMGESRFSLGDRPAGRWVFYQLAISGRRLATIYMIFRSLGAAGTRGFGHGDFRTVWNISTLALFHMAWGNCQASQSRAGRTLIPVEEFAQMMAGWTVGLAGRGNLG